VGQKASKASVYVAFSEDVALADLANGMRFRSGSAPMDGCVWREESCISAASTLKISAVDYVFDSKDLAEVPAVLTIDSSVVGSVRDFGQALALHGKPPPVDGKVEYQLVSSGWIPCWDGDSVCWIP